MTDLELLQELILAARADGDADTAAWLAGLADDPDRLRQFVASLAD